MNAVGLGAYSEPLEVTTAAIPTINQPGNFAAVSSVYGSASAATSLSVTGRGIVDGITATAPAGFEVSADGTSFAATATFSTVSGEVDGDLHIRLKAGTAAGTHAGTVTLTSSGAATVSVAVPESVVARKTLTVTASDATREAGEPNPEFAYEITGFVLGQTAASVVAGLPALTTVATGVSPAGTYAIVPALGTLVSVTGNYDFAFVSGSLVVTEPVVAPAMTALFVRGSSWTTGYENVLQQAGVGGPTVGYRLVNMAVSSAPTGPVTWTNINQIGVSFDRPITGALPTLSVVSGSGAVLTGSNPVLVQSATNTWRWALSGTLPAGKFLVLLDGQALEGGSSPTTLSGAASRTTSPVAASRAIADVAFTVIPGDANRSGSVNSADVTLKSRQVGARVTASNFRLDVNGSNSITTADVTVTSRNVGVTASRLPAPTRPSAVSPRTTATTSLALDPVSLAAWASLGSSPDDDAKKK